MTESDKELSEYPTLEKDNVIPPDMAACMDKFARTFEASARRWELVVYPTMIAFIVLASYGFFLIYTLTTDVNRVATSMESMVGNMDDVVTHMHVVSANVSNMSTNLASIATNVDGKADSMLVSMDNLNKSLNVMTVPMYQIRQDMVRMNENMHNVAGPMRMMGGMFPF